MSDGSSIEIDIRIAVPGWRTAMPNPGATIRRAVQAALRTELPAKARTGLNILLTDDAEMRKLNAGWRAKDKPTNVLSFPAENAVDPARPPAFLGDVALSLSTCRREAREQKKALADHVAHLTVHGVLHLLGYDHMDDDQAEAMEPLETSILAGMGIADPYLMPADKKAAKTKITKKKTAPKTAAKPKSVAKTKTKTKKKRVVTKKTAPVRAKQSIAKTAAAKRGRAR